MRSKLPQSASEGQEAYHGTGSASDADRGQPGVTERSLMEFVLTERVHTHTHTGVLQRACHVHELLLGAPVLERTGKERNS
jgi:hypothetical protein